MVTTNNAYTVLTDYEFKYDPPIEPSPTVTTQVETEYIPASFFDAFEDVLRYRLFGGYDTDTEYPSYAESYGYPPTQIGWLEAVIDRSGKVVTVEAIKG